MNRPTHLQEIRFFFSIISNFYNKFSWFGLVCWMDERYTCKLVQQFPSPRPGTVHKIFIVMLKSAKPRSLVIRVHRAIPKLDDNCNFICRVSRAANCGHKEWYFIALYRVMELIRTLEVIALKINKINNAISTCVMDNCHVSLVNCSITRNHVHLSQ